MSTDLTWNRKAMCVTCGRSDQDVRYHRGHVIARSQMQALLVFLNKIVRDRRYKDDESWNIVCQCAPCNHATYDGMAAINHPCNEKQALWKALGLHSEIYISLGRGVRMVALQALHEAGCKQEGVEVDEADKELIVEMAVDEAIRAVELINGANDLATLRQWYAEMQEAE